MSNPSAPDPDGEARLGLRANLGQFSLLVLVNAFVGAMVGMERSILSPLAERDFHLAARTAILSFIVVFGVTKALTNYLAGRLSDRFGRKSVLVGGWLVAIPVPLLLMWAPTWAWILFANALLGVSQGLTWSTTVIMKVDLAGPKSRGLAMGLNEFAGYLALAGAALVTGALAARYGLRPEPFYPGVVFVAAGLLLSVFVVRETAGHAAYESKLQGVTLEAPKPKDVFWRTTLWDRNLSSVSQAGLVNNLNDGMAWGLFPLFFAAAHMSLGQIGRLAALYPATWAVGQLFTGALSDRVGRKWLIVAGMWVQAASIGIVVLATGFAGFAAGAVLLGIGTAMVYPTLLAAIGDVAQATWRGSAIGVYRLWRDLGYAVGALVAGVTADAVGLPAALWLVAALTFVSGLVVALRMSETLAPSQVSIGEATLTRWHKKGKSMKTRYSRGIVWVLLAAVLGGSPQAPGQEAKPAAPVHVMVTPTDIQWAGGPGSLPPGAKFAVIEGDPKNAGLFTMRLTLPADYRIPAHWHPADEHVTVLSGTFHMGMGEKLDTTKGKGLGVGGFAVMPAKVQHFAWTNEETVIQLHGMGPWGINYVNPADDPRKK